MLQPIMHILANKRIVLASGSPRRKTILSNILTKLMVYCLNEKEKFQEHFEASSQLHINTYQISLSAQGLLFEVIPSTFNETLDKGDFQKPEHYAIETAKQKALEVADRLSQNQGSPDVIVGADTVVAMDGDIYEKPRSKEHAFDMLSRFSGNTHTVYTGVVLLTPNTGNHTGDTLADRFHIDSFSEATEVKFASVDSEIIKAYIETEEPMDKAGGYGIQAAGGTLVESINGDYFNVMGFPLHSFSKRLLQLFRDT